MPLFAQVAAAYVRGGANLRALFDSYDTDNSGTIELSELSAVVQRTFPDLVSISEVIGQCHRLGTLFRPLTPNP